MNGNNLSIPGSYHDKILLMFRDKGEVWISKLPDLVEKFIRKWELTECRIEENLSIHFICYAHSPKYGDVGIAEKLANYAWQVQVFYVIISQNSECA